MRRPDHRFIGQTPKMGLLTVVIVAAFAGALFGPMLWRMLFR